MSFKFTTLCISVLLSVLAAGCCCSTHERCETLFCDALSSCLKSDYSGQEILELNAECADRITLDGCEFEDDREWRRAMKVHLASGRYAIIRLQAVSRQEPAIRECADFAEYYGADFEVILPDGDALRRCYRCHHPE